ncbi:uncharacterized protein LOC143259675 [Megalopta genalis]|uniref:uncharacterized protein LOC143259675 n=1 Tax=Megalopta genalis TaxID=115081 RepID=UPI003FD6634E
MEIETNFWKKHKESLSSTNPQKVTPARNKTIHANTFDDLTIDVPITVANSNCTNNNLLANLLSKGTRIGQKAQGRAKKIQTLNNRAKRTIIGRSLDKNSDYLNSKERVPPTSRLYRHPKLSHEDQKKLRDELQQKVANLNLGNTLSRRVLSTFYPSQQSYKFEFSSEEPEKQGYVPVFPKSNSAIVLEGNSRNRSAPDDPIDLNNDKNNERDKYTRSETLKTSKKHNTPDGRSETIQQPGTKEQQREKTYINIQDHQRDIEVTTSSDILEYDPAKIPYVDVPDYSDIREESLDDEDRRLSRKMTAKTIDDSVDPEIPEVELNSEKMNGERKISDENGWIDENSPPNHSSMGELINGDGGGSVDESAENENPTARFESAIFDVNEYRKPFNLDEFLKDDPIMKKLQLLEKATPAMYGENRKRVAGFFNEPESDNTSRERAGLTKEEEQGGFDYLPKFSDFVEFAKVRRNKEYDDSNGNKKMEDRKSSNRDDNEHLSRHECRRKCRSKRRPVRALSSILDKKRRGPRLNKTVNERIKDEVRQELDCKKFWSRNCVFLCKDVSGIAQRDKETTDVIGIHNGRMIIIIDHTQLYGLTGKIDI